MAHDETVYDALAGAPGDPARWAFGGDFDDSLAGVDTTLPPGIDAGDLGAYCLMLGDDALVLAQRLVEWVTRAPELEEEVALANIALDLLGQARLLLARAGLVGVVGGARQRAGAGIPDEDALAYFRNAAEFRCSALASAPGGDFARTVLRLLVAATWRLALFARLRDSRDPVLAAVAGKGVAELAYHREHAARWVLRLGDGTAESHRRARTALGEVWPLTADLFSATDVERRLAAAGVAVEPAELREEVHAVLGEVLTRATLPIPPAPADAAPTGRLGRHGPDVGTLLTGLQRVAREHPGATW